MARPSRAKRQSPAPALEAAPAGTRLRIRLVLFLFLGIYAVIAFRLVSLQVVPSLQFSQEDLIHIGEVEIRRERGDILDARGRILATDRKTPSLSANPSRVNDAAALAAELSRRLGLDRDEVYARLSQTGPDGNRMKFVWIKRWLSTDEMATLGDVAALPDGAALMVQEEALRFYPEGELASHVLGFANRESVGAEGLELAFDRHLRSNPGRKVSRVDSKRNFLDFLTLEYDPPTGGDDLYLTLDAALQHTLEQELDKALEVNKAPCAMGVLMDPDTGAILALAARPAFDPNRYYEYPPEERKNRALTDVFEPGSAFKIVPAAAALEHGLIASGDLIDCEGGSFNPYGHRIKDTHKLGVVPFWQAFGESSNVAMIKVAALLGEERFESWIRRFGFGRRTGIELPGESPGIFHPRKNWSRLSMGSLPMGHEVAVNMLQLAQSFSAIANGGVLVEPYLVEKAVSPEGVVTYKHDPGTAVRILSEDTAAEMKILCHQVVAGKESTGRYGVIPEYRAGGKTGTAEIPREDGRGYHRDKHTTVFAGFAPIRDPRITCVIVVQEPVSPAPYGGYVCGPVFKEVVRETLVRLNVPPDPMVAPETTQVAQGLELEDPDSLGNRVLFDLLDPIELARGEFDGLELLTPPDEYESTGPVLPSFIGLTKWEAKERAVAVGVQWDPRGVGRVVAQDPPPGTPLKDVSVCRMTFGTGIAPAAPPAADVAAPLDLGDDA